MYFEIRTDPIAAYYYHLSDDEDMTLFNDIMALHPKLRDFITAISRVEDEDGFSNGYHNFCQMVRICAISTHIHGHSFPFR